MGVLYQVVSYASRIGFPLYFGRLEINGRDNIPNDKPYILAPNHQNAFMDAILTAVHCRDEVHFLTRSDVFVKPYKTILHLLNMMPVYRRRDGYEKLKKNDEIFAYCNQLLRDRKPVLIFPEGNMGPGHALRPLTKGTSRLAFRAQEEIEEDLLILPVGINYFHHDHPGAKAILNYGEPIRVRDYQDLYESNKAKGLIGLKDKLTMALRDLMLIPDVDDSYEDRVKQLHRNNNNAPFTVLKQNLHQKSYIEAPRPKQHLKWLSIVLALPNFGPLHLIHRSVSRLEDVQFTGSLKYILGLFMLPIWWVLLSIVSWLTVGFAFVPLVILICVGSLFARAAIQRMVR